jgi:hypothetical protein
MKSAIKSCLSCKWVRETPAKDRLCLNPINDHFFDWFNASTGDIVTGVRRISKAFDEGYCDEYAINKNPGPHWKDEK